MLNLVTIFLAIIFLFGGRVLADSGSRFVRQTSFFKESSETQPSQPAARRLSHGLTGETISAGSAGVLS
ncbi:MAG: hypothetical protein HC845_03640 [Akkermansiaceae bacterium]|nr:hypothetical protein [Akkermansiaceae bacterium]